MNGAPWVVQGQDWRESGRLGQRVADKCAPWVSSCVQGQDWHRSGRLGPRVADEQCSVGVQSQDWRGSRLLGERAGW